MFDLAKEEKTVLFSLEKKGLKGIVAEVSLVLDVSGSMQDEYQEGIVQEVVQKILPVALNFDDNGELDIYTFTSGKQGQTKAPTVTRNNYDGYVDRDIVRNSNIPKWSATDYSYVLENMMTEKGFISKGLFGQKFAAESKSKHPNIVYFITDGDNYDQDATTKLLEKAQGANSNVYVLFIGIGTATSFPYLRKVADKFDNTGFLSVSDFRKAFSQEDFHEQLLPDELTTWLREKK